MQMELSDSQLAVMAGQGDANAYRRLFERYQHPVYNFVYRMVDNAEDASDIVQDAFIKIYSVLGRQEIQNFSAYLYRTARNLAYDEMRRRSRFADVDHEVLVPEDPNIYADPQRALLLGEQMDKVRQAAAGLNENQRAALILRELEGLDYDEMSQVMDSNRNAIGALLSRARLKFREELRMAHLQTEKVPPECEAVIARLSPYIDGELEPESAAEVESHVAQCTFCAAALDEMREASRSFRILIPVIPPADMAEAFAGRLQQAAQSAGAETVDTVPDAAEVASSPVSGQDTAVGSRSLVSRILGSRITWIMAALIAAAGLGVFVLAGEVGREGGIMNLLQDEERDEPYDLVGPALEFDTIPTVRPAHSGGILLQEGQQPDSAGDDTGQDTPPEDTLPAGGGSGSGSRGIVSGYASPNPVYEDGQLAISVTVRGSPKSVSVSLAGGMTVPLTRQYTTSSGEVWSWSGLAPGNGYYAMTASASYSGGAASAGIGTLEVMYYLY